MIDILAELRLLNVAHEGSDDKFKVVCPFHEDEHPSCQIDTKASRFLCFSCNTKGPILTLLAKLRKETIPQTRTYIQQKYGVSLDKLISPDKIETCHQSLWSNPKLLAELTKRAVSKEAIILRRLGCENNRITIPIPNAAGFYVDLRYYLPGAQTNKFTSMKGYGGNNLYTYDQLDKKYDKIVLVGGEIKAIACAEVLNPLGYGVITNTTGEGKFEAAWIQLLTGRPVYVIMDIDEPGRKASAKLCHMIANSVESIYDVVLPFDSTKYPKGGPDDFIAAGHDLAKVLADTEPWQPTASEPLSTLR